MLSPIKNRKWIEFESLPSTQDYAINTLNQTDIGAIFAYHQTQGRGRFHKPWESEHHASLSMTLVCREYIHHLHPWVLGMALAITTAQILNLQLQWPNDLVLNKKKIGGILTEVINGIPLIGIGINLNQTSFPGIYLQTPTSIYIERKKYLNPKEIALQILSNLEYFPEPNQWKDIEPLWNKYDDTIHKKYITATGKIFKAAGIGDQGELLVDTSQGQEKISVAYYLENKYTLSSE